MSGADRRPAGCGPGIAVAGVAALLLAACARPPAPEPLLAMPRPPGFEETGIASWYGRPYHGRRTASGETFDMYRMTAAHRTLPFGTWLSVENLGNGRTVEVRVNDRGPFVGDRVLDVSYGAARILDAVEAGLFPVRPRTFARSEEAAPGAPAVAPWVVQVGSFEDEAGAVALQRDLLARAFHASVVRAKVGDRAVYRVRVGPFPGRAAAHDEASRLARAGYTVIIVDQSRD